MPKKTERRGIGSIYYSETHTAWVAELNLGKDGLTGKRKTIKRYFKGPETDKKIKREAEKKLAELIADHGRGVLSDPTKLTVNEWMDDHLKRRNSQDIVNVTRRANHYSVEYIKKHIGTLQMQQVQPYHLQQVLDAATRDYSHSSRMKILTAMRKGFQEAHALGVIAKNPMLQIQAPRAPRHAKKKGIAWTQKEVDLILAAATAQRMFPLWCLAFSTGARIGELQALKLQDLDLHTMRVQILRTVSGHGTTFNLPPEITEGKSSAAQRIVPLPENLKPILVQWLERRAADKREAGQLWQEHEWLFPTTLGTLTHYQTLYRNFRKVVQVTKVTPGTIHDIRRTYITLSIRAGVMPEVVAKLVGHSSIKITLEEYRKIQSDEVDEAAVKVAGIIRSVDEKGDLSLQSHYGAQMKKRPRTKKAI
ncbi:tyrosine-type recombinase/integrase [Deinococcus misasensis]|uniref:tyrosine-type recombinase/integrase n=1 Tax=Deinococcus misasensis TaxID=392413 RepID=UPI0005578FCE|nr:site-specific integrase [Deinococcus misasensis]